LGYKQIYLYDWCMNDYLIYKMIEPIKQLIILASVKNVLKVIFKI